LGEYAAADRLVKPVMVIGGIFLASALPTIAVMAHEGKFSELTSAYRKTLVRLLGLFAPVVAVAWLVAPLLLEKLAPGWVGAVWPFRILSLATVFMLVNSLTSVFITALGQLRLVTGVALINLVVFFALAHVLVPRYGATGAALATTLMEGINTALQVSIVVALLRRGAVG
jgi:O-antigen/teichoic acid export membrane protein